MKKLEQIVSKYINDVCRNIRNTSDDKELFYLYNRELSGLDEVIRFNDLNIYVPYELENYRKYGFDGYESFAFVYYDGFKEIYNSVKEINKDLALVGGELFGERELVYDVKPSLELSISDSMKIVQLFFEYYDNDVKKHFKKICDDDNLIVAPLFNGNTIDGFTLTLNSLKENFIEVNFRNDILLSSNIIHEVFHSYVESHMLDLSYDERKKRLWNNLDEVITYFSSLVFIQFLEEINFDNNSIQFLKSDSASRMIFFTGEFNKYFDLTYEDIIFGGFEDYLLSDSIAYGTLLAYHYYDKYLLDENKVKDDILNMSLDTANKDKMFLLNNYGLSSDDIGDLDIPKKILRKYGYNFTEKK